MASDVQREAAYNFIREKMELFGESSGNVEVDPAPDKKPRLDLSDEDLEDSDEDCTDEPVLDELTLYLQSRLRKNNGTPI